VERPLDAQEIKEEFAGNSHDDYLSVRNCFIFGEPIGFFEPLTALQQQDSPLRAPLDTFGQNLGSALLVGSIPFQFAHSNVLNVRFNQLLAAESIRALKFVEPGKGLDQAAEQLAREVAQKRMNEELADKSIIDRHANNTLRQSHFHSAAPDLRASSEELLRQVLVMSWGAFETVANDLVRLLLNLKPILVQDARQGRPYKDVLNARNLLDGLESARFNLADCMGDFLSSLVSLDSLEKMQTAAQVIFGSAVLDACLKDARLWLIAQQRHLIVHRRSVVDERYRERTGDLTAVGNKLTFDAAYVEQSMSVLRDIGCLLYSSACGRLSALA